MKRLNVPFNIFLLEITKDILTGLRPVTSLDIFDGSTMNLHEDGLFSQTIFGRVGDELRDLRFSYIDIGIPILHPIVYNTLVRLKGLYGGIMSGTEFAIWNDEIKDFERATALTGKTGYHFFITKWKEINFKETGSDIRSQMISLISKYKDIAMTDKIIVIPAGLRDVEISDSGRPEEPEINPLYRRLLAISKVVTESAVRNNPEILDTSRNSLQNTFNEISDVLEAMINGKKKLILGKWASRKIFNTTRNVASAMDTSCKKLGDSKNIKFNNTVVGLYQYLKSTLPVSKYQILSGIIAKSFISKDLPVTLVNKTTLHSASVNLPIELFDTWASDNGIEKVINKFESEDVRHLPVEIGGYYLALIYKGPDDTFKIIQDIDEVPEGRSKDDVHPMTFCEFLYLSVYKKSGDYPAFVARYPITGIGSIYPSFLHLKPTNVSESRVELDDAWNPIPENVASEFPTSGSFVNTLIPHPSRNLGLGLDYDGDTISLNVVISDEAIAEVKAYLGKKKAYVGTDGRFVASVGTDTVNFVFYNLTGS